MSILVAYLLPPTNLLLMFSQFATATWQLLCKVESTVIRMLDVALSSIETLEQPQRCLFAPPPRDQGSFITLIA